MTEMDQQAMGDLFQKFLENACSPAETEQLMEWLQQPENQLLWRGWIRQQLEVDMPGHVTQAAALPDHLERRLQAIMEKINTPTEAPVEQMPSRSRRPRLFIAASLIGLLGLAGLFIYRQTSKQASAAVDSAKTDIPPGGNKAVLTLASGKQIVLDDAGNGALAKQGNATVVKTGGGKLAYEAAKEKTISTEIVYNTLATPRGGQFELTLPDGTATWLNSASSIKYPTAFTGAERTVEVTGEVFFDVKKNPAQPFRVKVNGKEQVEVLGTSFDVNSYDDEAVIKTTLVDGAVKVSILNNPRSINRKLSPSPNSVVIKPGQQAQLANQGNQNGVNAVVGQPFTVIKDADIDEVLAWKQDMFLFYKSDLETILRQVSRWYNVDVVFRDKYTNQHFGGGISRKLNLSQVLKMLEASGVRFKLEDKNLVVLPKEK
jgi:transmembrane sensor